MPRKHRYNPPEPRDQVATYTYDSQGRLAAACDSTEHSQFACYDMLGRLIDYFPAEKVKGPTGAGTVPDSSTATERVWTFSRRVPKEKSAFDVYVSPATPPRGRKWQSRYTVCGGTLAPASDPADTPFGPGWYKLGSVTVPAGTSEVTIRYHGSGGKALGAIVVVRKVL